MQKATEISPTNNVARLECSLQSVLHRFRYGFSDSKRPPKKNKGQTCVCPNLSVKCNSRFRRISLLRLSGNEEAESFWRYATEAYYVAQGNCRVKRFCRTQLPNASHKTLDIGLESRYRATISTPNLAKLASFSPTSNIKASTPIAISLRCTISLFVSDKTYQMRLS